MEFANLDEMIATKKRKVDLFGTDNLRCWILNFEPGDGTDMHYHANPETFLVLSGGGTVKGLKGEEKDRLRKMRSCFSRPRTITR